MTYKRIRFLGLTSIQKDIVDFRTQRNITGQYPSYEHTNHITASRDKIIIYDI